MFTQLIESGARRRRIGGQGTASLVLHLAAGVGVVHATRSVELIGERREVPLWPIAVPPLRQAEAHRGPLPIGRSDVPAPPELVIVPPVGEVVVIPPIDWKVGFDPLTYSGRPIPRGGCDSACGPSATDPITFVESGVDEPAAVISQPSVEYPPMLKAAGIAGRVTLEFVVDLLGNVERGSVRVFEATDPAFVPSAERVARGSRFTPARLRGQAVRQLVRQSIRYRIDP